MRRSDKDTGLLTPEEEKVLQRVQRSQVWRLIRDALVYKREQLFSAELRTSEELWQNRGQIQEINTLLHTGPSFVVIYHRHLQATAETRDDPGIGNLVRDFTPPDLE